MGGGIDSLSETAYSSQLKGGKPFAAGLRIAIGSCVVAPQSRLGGFGASCDNGPCWTGEAV
jgi:hypothetical protein